MDSMPSHFARANILGVGVSAVNPEMAVEQIAEWIRRREHRYVCVANVHTITESQQNTRLRQINNSAGMVTPDGMPLVWVSKLQGFREVERVYGPDLLLATCQCSLQTGWTHYFYGGGPGVVEQLAKQLTQLFPGLKIAGFSAPPFRALTSLEDEAAVAEINQSGADILWVGLGAPKQEYWMAEHLGRIAAPVMVGVGAAFDFHAGVKKQAPRWMQRSGLEWVYRLFQEPRRLWRRYLVYNPRFLYGVFLQLTGLRKYPLEP